MLQIQHEGTGQIFYATSHSAGFDICANEDLLLEAQKWKLVKTGLRISSCQSPQMLTFGSQQLLCLPEIQIRPRSGLAAKFGITVLNAPSTIDCDYRGEILVTLINHSQEGFHIKKGDRIAQAVCALVFQMPGVHVKPVERGLGGFGSTGHSSGN